MCHAFDTEQRGSNSFKANLLPLCLIIASFGPYVSFTLDLRTEHVVIYTIFPLALANLSIRKTNSMLSYPPLSLLLFLWIFVTLWTLGSTFIGEPKYESFWRMLAYFENYVQSIAIIFIFGAFIRCNSLTEAQKLFCNACKILILLLTLNACASVLSLFFDTSIILKYFPAPTVTVGDVEWNVALGSRQMGRFMGIFNQPMECGLTYSVGLFAWIYIMENKIIIKMIDILLLMFIFIGGILSVSKIFIFGGLPVAFLYSLWTLRLKRFLKLRYFFFGIIALILFSILFQRWDLGEGSGLNYLLRLFTTDIDLQTITGGRFGGDEGILGSFAYVWNEAPMIGLGFAAKTTLDNGYLEFFLQGGLVGLILYILILLSIGWTGIKNYGKSSEGKFLLILFIFIIGAGLGSPVLTINRFSTIFCVFLLLIYLIFNRTTDDAALKI